MTYERKTRKHKHIDGVLSAILALINLTGETEKIVTEGDAYGYRQWKVTITDLGWKSYSAYQHPPKRK